MLHRFTLVYLTRRFRANLYATPKLNTNLNTHYSCQPGVRTRNNRTFFICNTVVTLVQSARMKTQMTVYLGDREARQVILLRDHFSAQHGVCPISQSAWLAYIVSQGLNAITRQVNRGKPRR